MVRSVVFPNVTEDPKVHRQLVSYPLQLQVTVQAGCTPAKTHPRSGAAGTSSLRVQMSHVAPCGTVRGGRGGVRLMGPNDFDAHPRRAGAAAAKGAGVGRPGPLRMLPFSPARGGWGRCFLPCPPRQRAGDGSCLDSTAWDCVPRPAGRSCRPVSSSGRPRGGWRPLPQGGEMERRSLTAWGGGEGRRGAVGGGGGREAWSEGLCGGGGRGGRPGYTPVGEVCDGLTSPTTVTVAVLAVLARPRPRTSSGCLVGYPRGCHTGGLVARRPGGQGREGGRVEG